MREFLWSEDMADACVFLLHTLDSRILSLTKGSRNTHVNIGTGIDISIKELANQIKNCIGFKGNFTYDTSKPDGTINKLTDVSRLHQLGWRHTVSLQEGVEKMYKQYISQ